MKDLKTSGPLGSSEFSGTDALLREAGIDTGQLNVEAALNQVRDGGDIQLPAPSTEALRTTNEETEGEKTETEKTSGRKKSEPIPLDTASKEAIASFQKTKDLPSFITAVRAVRRTAKDMSTWKLFKVLGIQPYWAKDRMNFFELDAATQELILKAGHDISALQLKKLLREAEGGREALLNAFIGQTSASVPKKPRTERVNAGSTESDCLGSLTEPAPTPIATAIAGINARIGLVEEAFGNFLNDLIAFSQLPSPILSELIRTNNASSLKQALQKLIDSTGKDE